MPDSRPVSRSGESDDDVWTLTYERVTEDSLICMKARHGRLENAASELVNLLDVAYESIKKWPAVVEAVEQVRKELPDA